eukprot:scaffold111927_cov30-Prasinocladus_malaysianus.AAC.1
MHQLEVLVRKLLSVYGLPARAVVVCEVSPLTHEARDDAVEGGALVVQPLARLAHPALARAQRPEVLRGPWHHILAQLDDYPACGLGAYLQ